LGNVSWNVFIQKEEKQKTYGVLAFIMLKQKHWVDASADGL
jgi:hypothetical protein